ncbi:GNAT family N-acetyltransferase [Pelomonas sp. APW6]|uniref:GNAT family N-acetyltransferase n=1 Tax=Roseateles subflavus TaxID=3053353 RepID=A0ABT7LLC4_9BURK|nr:GNAT family N-acetyltransferase [Pelomonas sp. APW6]MDL5033264.1 GNAT family N-acetyltransferase [Pelomonas sp. APW6]
MSKLDLQPFEDLAAWDALVQRSPQGSLFCESWFAEAAREPVQRFAVMQKGTLKAGLCLPLAADGRGVIAPDLTIYAGLLYDLDAGRQRVKRRHDEFQIAEFVAAELATRFERVELQLAPQIEDLRPWLWHDYHGPAGGRFQLDLRYTTVLDISSLQGVGGSESAAQASTLFAEMETVRRYSVREGWKKGGRVEIVHDSAPLIDFYRALMSAQGQPPEEHRLQAMAGVMQGLISRGRGAIFHVLDAEGQLLYAVGYGWDERRAYYLYGAGSPDRSAPWQGTLAHWVAFQYLAQEHGLSEVDLEGVNSPQRGWFKLGFGGDLVSYACIRRGEQA